MSKKQIYPSPSRTRTVYPPIRANRQAIIELNVIEQIPSKLWYEYFPGEYIFTVNLIVECMYVYIYSSTTATVILRGRFDELGRVREIRIELSRDSIYRSFIRTFWQPVTVIVTKEEGLVNMYFGGVMIIAGERVVARVTPRSFNELFRIYGDNLIGKYTQKVEIYTYPLVEDEQIDFYVNGEYYGSDVFGKFDLDREVVVTARGRGIISMPYIAIYAGEIILDVDVAYIFPTAGFDVIPEGAGIWYQIPCIYKKPKLRFVWTIEPPIALVLEIADELKQYIEHIDTEPLGGICLGEGGIS